MKLKPGDKIPLSHHLGDGVTGKYVRATVKDSDGAQIPGSPVNLIDLGNGTYYNDTLEMPSKIAVMAAFTTYEDSGYSERSDDYDDSFNMYLLDDSETLSLEDTVTGYFLDLQSVRGQIDDVSSLKGVIEDDSEIVGNIYTASPYFGRIEDEQTFKGIIED